MNATTKSIALFATTASSAPNREQLEKRFGEILLKLGTRDRRVVCCSPDVGGPPWLSVSDCETVVVGWGLREPPDWEGIFRHQLAGSNVRHLLVFDLTDDDWTGRFPMRRKSGRSRSTVVSSDSEVQFNKFVRGAFPVNPVPYAYRRIAGGRSIGSIIEPIPPAESGEVSIVRLIFDLFVNCRMSRVAIANLLNAEGVQPPPRNPSWNSQKLEGILSDPVYFGASRYKGFLRMDTFPAILEEALFWAARARILSEKRPALDTTTSHPLATFQAGNHFEEKKTDGR